MESSCIFLHRWPFCEPSRWAKWSWIKPKWFVTIQTLIWHHEQVFCGTPKTLCKLVRPNQNIFSTLEGSDGTIWLRPLGNSAYVASLSTFLPRGPKWLGGKAVGLVIQKVLGSNFSWFISLSLSWKKSSTYNMRHKARPDYSLVTYNYTA